MHDQGKFIIAAIGIFFTYFYFGILQEKITRSRYGERTEDGNYEKFTYTLTLVGVQCLWNWIFAKGMFKSTSSIDKFLSIFFSLPINSFDSC